MVDDGGGAEAAAAHDLTFDDATYVALALEEDAVLVTGDDVMREAAEDAGVEVRDL